MAAKTLQPGDFLAERWRIERVHRGGMGLVYVLTHVDSGARFAAKTFSDDAIRKNESIAERFERESEVWIAMGFHANVVSAYHFERVAGRPYLFLEYVDGGDVSQWIGKKQLTPERILTWSLQICDAMAFAQSAGVQAHRDLKPKNCLLTRDKTIKLTDFGLAKVFSSAAAHRADSLIPQNESVGTPLHMAPEQFDDDAEIDVRADIYAFGLLLCQMLTGRLPFIAKSKQELAELHRQQALPALPIDDARLLATVRTCLEKAPADRFQDFRQLRADLAEAFRASLGREPPPSEFRRHDNELALLNRSHALFALGAHERALVAVDACLRLSPGMHEAWVNRGASLAALGRPREAVECYDRALRLRPGDYRPLLNKGASLLRLGDTPAAVECLNLVASLAPSEARVWHNLGEAYWSVNLADEARGYYERALSLDPSLAAAWNGLANILLCEAKGKLESAPTEGYVYAEELDEAITKALHALDLSPDHAASRKTLADAHDLLVRFLPASAKGENLLWRILAVDRQCRRRFVGELLVPLEFNLHPAFAAVAVADTACQWLNDKTNTRREAMAALDRFLDDGNVVEMTKAYAGWKLGEQAAWQVLCELLLGLGVFRVPLEFSRAMLGESLELPHRLQCAKLLNQGGIVCRHIGAWSEALASYESARAVFAAAGDEPSLGHVWYNSAVTLRMMRLAGESRPEGRSDDAAFEIARELYARCGMTDDANYAFAAIGSTPQHRAEGT